MKKHLLLLCMLTGKLVYAQVPEDAVRYSFYPQNGTARNMAIGGAMGSLGGDINATFVNPAGLGFYKTNEFVLTPGFSFNNNKADFRKTNTQNSRNNIGFGTTGWVFGQGDSRSKNSSAFSIAITQAASFNNEVHYKGLNDMSSFAEQFAEEFAKSGYTIDEVLTPGSTPFPYTSAPALYTYLIDTVTIGGINQVVAAPEYILAAGQALQQEMVKKTRGSLSEISVGFAHNSKDKWFIGGAIGIPLVVYSSNTVFTESDTSGNTANYFNRFEYTDDFKTSGIGFNGKIGIIYRPQDYIRLGLAIHTPTWMFLTDTHSSSLVTEVENPVDKFTIHSDYFTNGQAGESKYVQRTPFKAIISGSYVFREVKDVTRQKGFISADIEYVHHGGSRFSLDNEDVTEEQKDYYKTYYKALNKVVKKQYKGNFNFRLGGELKFRVLMARLGFAYYGSPYKDKALKANRLLLSGGLGYRNKGFFADLTYVNTITKDVNFPYRLQDKPNTFAELKQQRGTVVATVGFKW